jgi:hypothetical protein
MTLVKSLYNTVFNLSCWSNLPAHSLVRFVSIVVKIPCVETSEPHYITNDRKIRMVYTDKKENRIFLIYMKILS